MATPRKREVTAVAALASPFALGLVNQGTMAQPAKMVLVATSSHSLGLAEIGSALSAVSGDAAPYNHGGRGTSRNREKVGGTVDAVLAHMGLIPLS